IAPVENVGERSTPHPHDGFSTSPLRKPPRVHAPCIGRVTGRGRSPDSRVQALLRPPGDYPSGPLKTGSPLTVAGAVPQSIRCKQAASLTRFPIRPLLTEERHTSTVSQ